MDLFFLHRLTIFTSIRLVKIMKLSETQIRRIASKISKSWAESSAIVFKADKEQIVERIIRIIRADLDREAGLDREVLAMMDQLERTHSGEFERYKMFPKLKKRLAEQKGIIL